jgi:sterol desaturase/sphingolipid hydroxylase (fatty acid hydroxylase superfamily)
MALLSLEHSPIAYGFDFALYGVAAAGLTVGALWNSDAGGGLSGVVWLAVGLFTWTWLEYSIHRFVLHGLQPFLGWHAQHHQRPTALIYSPTLLSAALIGCGVFLPAWQWGGPRVACALTLGVVLGNLGYSVTHHATHHWRARSAWGQARKRWHAAHHQSGLQMGSPMSGQTARPAVCFGVTTGFWDHLLGTRKRQNQS